MSERAHTLYSDCAQMQLASLKEHTLCIVIGSMSERAHTLYSDCAQMQLGKGSLKEHTLCIVIVARCS